MDAEMSKTETMSKDAIGLIADGRRRRGARSRAAILSHAIGIASREGLDGLTIGRIASDAGISKGNVTVLFGDKQAIQVATLDAAVELFVARVVAPAAGHKSPLRRLRALVEGWFDFVEQRVLPGGCMLYATCSEYRARPGRIRERAVQHREAWNRQLASAAREAKKMKELDADLDVEQLVFELTAFQSIANTAALAGDRDALARARRSSLQRIRSGNTA